MICAVSYNDKSFGVVVSDAVTISSTVQCKGHIIMR